MSQGLSTLPQGLRFPAIGQPAVMAHADKPSGQRLQEKAPEKGVRRHLHGLELITLGPMTIGKADLPMTDVDDAIVGDSHAMRIAPKVLAFR